MNLRIRSSQPGDPVEPTAAEIFADIDARRDDLRARLEAARTQRADLSETVKKARATFRSALTRAELAGGVPPSRNDVTQLEQAFALAEDRVAGLEAAVEEFEAEWRAAQVAVWREAISTKRAAIQQLQQDADRFKAERLAAEREENRANHDVFTAAEAIRSLEEQIRTLK
jgi:chromosome segregation ATPase